MATFDAVFVGSGINSLAGAALLAREGWCVCVLERNDRAGGCIRTVERPDPAGLHARGPRLVAPPLHRVRRHTPSSVTSSGGAASTYVNTDLPTGAAFPDGSAAFVTASLEGNVTEFDRLRAGRRRRLGAPVRRVHGQRRSLLRDPRHGALVDGGALARAEGAAAPRTARVARLRRYDARQLPRLAHRDVSVGGRARRPRSLGSAHGPRARAGDVRLHDSGHRRRAPARRYAGAGRRRRPPRRCPRRDRHGRGRRGAAAGRRAASRSSRTAARRVSASRTARPSVPRARSSRA